MKPTYQFILHTKALLDSLFSLVSLCLLLNTTYSTCLATPTSNEAIKHYNFGISETNTRNASKEELEVAFTQMIAAVAGKHKIDIKIIAYENSQQLDKALKNKEIQGFFGSPLDFFRNINLLNQAHIYTIITGNKNFQRYLLLVRKDAHHKDLVSLKNQKLAYSISDEVGIAYLNHQIQLKNLGNQTTFFKQLLPKKYGGLTTTAVFFKEADAGLVLESDFDIAAELNPQLKQQLVSLVSSPQYINNVIAYSNALSIEEIASLNEIMNSVHKNEKGNKLLNMFKAQGAVKIDTNDLNSVRELIKMQHEGVH